ncbi:MAG TPA: Gfo/Idh/MocA family oxidoreductase [Longimicrobiales bacterium]|nr:Gfo/Idh/MocA family oxidoreductase [Longimicrobiales bacterium]
MSKVRVAVVGAGILGRRHARVFHEIEGARLVAVADPSLEKATAAAEPAGALAFEDLGRLLEAVECDVVAIATPDHLHATPVLAALAAGKHVLVEKPLATTLAEARAMVDEAARRGLVLQVNYSQRGVPEYAWMKEQIDAGAIGRPALVQSSKQDTVFVPTRMIRWAAATSPIFFMSSHDIDLVTWFVGGRARRVRAVERRGTLEALGVAAADGVDALVEYDTGAVASFHSSWILPNSYPSITVDRMIVAGETGVLHFESRGRQVECYGASGGRSVTFSGPQTATELDGRLEGAFRASLLGFLDAVRGGTEPATSGARTLHVVEIQAAILESAARGVAVEIG